jgi:hypothetical protein
VTAPVTVRYFRFIPGAWASANAVTQSVAMPTSAGSSSASPPAEPS